MTTLIAYPLTYRTTNTRFITPSHQLEADPSSVRRQNFCLPKIHSPAGAQDAPQLGKHACTWYQYIKGRFLCKIQESKATDNAMFILFDTDNETDNETCLYPESGAQGIVEKGKQAPQEQTRVQLVACRLARVCRAQPSWGFCG